MDIITWIVVGTVAGILAAAVLGSGFGLLGDIALGIAGSFVGSWTFREMGWRAPFAGFTGVITVAFLGAVIVLGGLHLIRGGRARR